MQVFYEAIELLPQDSRLKPENPRIDVTDYPEDVRVQVRASLIDIMAGRTYTLRKHTHRHEENQPCSVEAL